MRENQVPGLVKAAETGPRVEASTDAGRQRQTPRGLTLRTVRGTHTAGRPLGTEKSPVGGGCFHKQPGARLVLAEGRFPTCFLAKHTWWVGGEGRGWEKALPCPPSSKEA